MDIDELMKLLHSWGNHVDGVLYAVDPELGHILLLTENEEKWHPVVVMHHATTSVRARPDITKTCPLNLELDDIAEVLQWRSDRPEVPPEVVEKRRSQLLSLLAKNRLNCHASSDGTIVVVGSVTIVPPYEPQDCMSHNTVVLGKVKAIVEKMYEDNEQQSKLECTTADVPNSTASEPPVSDSS